MDYSTKLSVFLLTSGWIPTLGSRDIIGTKCRDVVKGTPFLYNTCNDITVVYDERGWPWINKGENIVTQEMIIRYNLENKKNIYVPHSRGSGSFLRIVGIIKEEHAEKRKRN